MKAEGFEPRLVANPADDVVFAAYAETLLEHGAASIAELEARLRLVYPRASVHVRELAGERVVVWYVYRDGHWVRTRTAAEQAGGSESDARSTRRSSVDGGIDP